MLLVTDTHRFDPGNGAGLLPLYWNRPGPTEEGKDLASGGDYARSTA